MATFFTLTYFTEGCMDLPRETIGSQGWSVPEFLRKPIDICDFPGFGLGHGPPVAPS